MAYEECKSCRGIGSINSNLNPWGYKYTAGMGRDVCPSCNGKGKKYVHKPSEDGRGVSAEGPGLHVWFFGLIGAFFSGALQPFGLWWPLAAFLGFAFSGMTAGFLAKSRTGRIILFVIGGSVVLFIVAGFFFFGRSDA